MHAPDIYRGHNTKDAEHWNWLQKKHFKPVYMQEIDPLVPDSARYPLREAQELAGVKLFTSTFAYMAALAILKGYEEIKIYGVELSSSEYDYQKLSYYFWFGFLRARLGDKVDSAVAYLDKNIFTAPLYGYEGNFAFGADYFAERAKSLDAEWRAADKSLQNIKKSLDKAVKQKHADEIRKLSSQYQSAAIHAGEIAGALSEAERYQTFGNRYADRGGFEYAAAKAQRDGEQKKPLVWHYGGMLEYVWNVWKAGHSPTAENQMTTFIETMGKTAYDLGAFLGVYKENIRYINKYDQIADAGGRVLLETNDNK